MSSAKVKFADLQRLRRHGELAYGELETARFAIAACSEVERGVLRSSVCHGKQLSTGLSSLDLRSERSR